MPGNLRYVSCPKDTFLLIDSPSRSEVDDLNIGLEHYQNFFDVAHTRLIAAGVMYFIWT